MENSNNELIISRTSTRVVALLLGSHAGITPSESALMDSPTSSLVSLAGLVDLDTYSIPPAPEPPEGYLLSLPYEVRAQIWEEYFEYRNILDLRLYCRRPRCAKDNSQSTGDENHNLDPPASQHVDLIYIGSLKQKRPTCYTRFYELGGSDRPRQWLSLLCTNQQVRQEVEGVLFRRRAWIVDDGVLPLRLDCLRDHGYAARTFPKYHSVHLTLQSHLPPSELDSHSLYSTIFLSLKNFRYAWDIYIVIDLVHGRDMHLMDWISRTLCQARSSTSIHFQNCTSIEMRYLGHSPTNNHRQECWPARHRREFMDGAWMRFQLPGLDIVGAAYLTERDKACYLSLKERAPFTLISPVKNEHGDGTKAPITRVYMVGGKDLWDNHRN